MLNLGKYRLFLGAAALFLLLLTHAHALTVTYSGTLSSAVPGFSTGFTLPAFDSNLGTLDFIDLSYAFSASGSVGINGSGGSQPGEGYYGGSVTSVNFLSTPSNVGPGLSPEVIPVQVSVGGGPAPGGFSLATGVGGASGSVTTDPATYANWIAAGGGNLSFNLSADAPSYGGGGFGVSFVGPASMEESGTFTLTYTYTAIPEPSTMGMLAAGAFLALFYRSWRSKRNGRNPVLK